MHLLENETVWFYRWEALRGSIVGLIESLVEEGVDIAAGALSGADDLSDLGVRLEKSLNILQADYREEHNKNVAELLVRLLTFSDTLFHFFHSGYFESNSQPKHETPLYHVLKSIAENHEDGRFFQTGRLSSDAVIHALLKQTAEDFVRIQQVFNLRFGEVGLNEEQRKNLLMATLLVNRGIQRFQHSNLTGPYYDELVVLAYPNDRLEVRLQPYCESLFIGFPVTAFYQIESNRYVNLSTDYIALAHEAGHIAYRFGRLPEPSDESEIVTQRERTVKHALSLLPELQNQTAEWQEELFCDLYGCFVEGPVFAVGFQALLANNPPEDFLAHNYPTPALRPLMHTQILRALAARQTDFAWPSWVSVAADKLDALWRETLHTNWQSWLLEDDSTADQLLDKQYTLRDGEQTGSLILERVNTAIEAMIDQMIGWGFHSDGANWADCFASETAVADMTPEEVAEQLYRQYCDTAAQALIAEQETRAAIAESEDNPIAAYASSAVLDQIETMQSADDLIFFLLDNWSDAGPSGGHIGNG